jgi:lambda repressor-like predicted transcriptional regulator
MPTLALVAVERGLGPSTPDPVLGTVANRCSSAPGLTPCEAEILLPRLIADLRNDEISGNAERAIWLLRSLARRVPSATRALEATLDSPDWQQRQLACYVLGELPLYAPSTRMLEVSVEALADDQLPYASGSKAGAESFTDVDNGRRALRTLARHAELAASMLEHALAGGDPQQRRFAAAAIAAGRIERLYPEAMPVLVESLDDRKVAVPALMLAGEGALVHLEPALHAPGKSRAAQARRIIQYILAAARAEKGDAKAIDRLPHLWTEAAYGQAWLTKDVLTLSR